ncbi:MAG: hypothetical protein KDK45_09075, partial [Leptospiraceae bacterium]|nr:hypothetical protein [Leptospiraceae bacterium]
PSLKRGETVVLDRYYYSTAAYQGKDIEDAKRILKKNQKLFPAPDYILFLSISPKKALQRITERNPEKEIFESLPKLQLIDSIFRKTLPESSIYLDSENLLSEALLKEFIARM